MSIFQTLFSLVAGLVLCSPGADPPTQYLYVSINASGNIHGGKIAKIAPGGSVSTLVGGLTNPHGVAFDSNGNLYEASTAEILKFTPGGVQTKFAGDIQTACLAFDAAGNLYASDYIHNTIVKFMLDGTKSVFATRTGPNCQWLAFDAAGNLYEAEANRGHIFKYTAGGVKTTFADHLLFPRALAIHGGYLYVNNNKTILKFASDGTQSVFATLEFVPEGLAFDSNGSLYASDARDRANGKIIEIKPDGTQSLYAGGMNFPVSLVFGPNLSPPSVAP